ncbi:long-chain-acyl-CoA synthetase [Caulobacter sp. 17J80-11]|uniref:long-chain-acyl-CoA synthetase n=1 Tax=Caulobacter sp. 17J80-11 TaxID=2763502 RepID=UPI00165381B3|nr:long-chain-acyl-CoA synthetase [Caulobacter sp. 17J80-11]MBC6980383.1 long-chain-acyl-CoA synthetase [Caulobacter sp. 17J80-11]
MGLLARARRELKFTGGLQRLLKRIKTIDPASNHLLCDDWEQAVDRWPENVAVIFEDRQITYRDLDQMANRYAHWAKGRNIRRGDTVALYMPNRIEYLAIWLGLSKVGVATALINSNLTGGALAHSLSISGAGHVLADYETYAAFEDVRHQLPRSVMLWVLGLRAEGETSDRRGLDTAVKGASAVRPDKGMRMDLTASSTALYIYTSGTTGLPKAAKITHARAQLYMRAFAAATAATPADRVYVCLPLYHSTGGLCGVGAALLNGGAVVLKKRFSASQFWPDVVDKGCTMFVYIGELCRYLVNSPEHELERKHKLRLAFGNGLRPDIWKTFQSRFAIPEILEFYGSTEGNVSLFNFDGRPGAVGRIPGYLRKKFDIRLVKFDMETEEPMRGANGLCVEARPGEIGEAIGLIGTDARHAYSGYADKAASEKKILRDVLTRGDAWFRTGDLMRQDSDGYFYFVDRVGDTFRWKGENVSTTEVAERLSEAPGVREVTVYGVPIEGMEGKAGMAALVVDDGFQIERLGAHMDSELPGYARPIFVRIQTDLETTGTFKYRKVDLAADGFDHTRTKDAIWFRDPEKGWVKMTARVREKLLKGEARV